MILVSPELVRFRNDVGGIELASRRHQTYTDAHLQNFYVAEGARGRGFGRALFNEAVDYAKSRGYDRITANVSNERTAKCFDIFDEADLLIYEMYRLSGLRGAATMWTVDDAIHFFRAARQEEGMDVNDSDELLTSGLYFTVALKT